FDSPVQLLGNGWNCGKTLSGPWSRNLERSTQVSPPHAGHDEAPISKHASQSRHNARRRNGKCSDSAVLRVWRMWTRATSPLIPNVEESGKSDATRRRQRNLRRITELCANARGPRSSIDESDRTVRHRRANVVPVNSRRAWKLPSLS